MLFVSLVLVQTGYNCQPYYHIDADGQGGHLSSLITEETMQGTALCPWLVRVQRGQRINVTMMDFSVLRNNAGNVSLCDMYAIIKVSRSKNRALHKLPSDCLPFS